VERLDLIKMSYFKPKNAMLFTYVSSWTCGYKGHCRRSCLAWEYTVGHHGCPLCDCANLRLLY
uniref:Uncharacterized protein n=1 Tax=Erpetoichthys calabaricus TaxID=27687 RepID=A0A8C4S1Q8_ERPCA